MVGGGDGMECAFDPIDPKIFYESTPNGEINKHNNGNINRNKSVIVIGSVTVYTKLLDFISYLELRLIFS